LEAGRAAQQAHGAGDPLELAHAGHREGSVGPGSEMQDHLPESCCQVYCAENGADWPANFADAFADVLHDVFIGVGLVVKGSEVLH